MDITFYLRRTGRCNRGDAGCRSRVAPNLSEEMKNSGRCLLMANSDAESNLSITREIKPRLKNVCKRPCDTVPLDRKITANTIRHADQRVRALGVSSRILF